jgi:hypothetical protein
MQVTQELCDERLPAAFAAPGRSGHWKTGLKRAALIAFYVLAAVQFVGSYLYLEWDYVDVRLWERGYAHLPFQTRLLLAPLYQWFGAQPWAIRTASRLARDNTYFFPRGLTPEMMLEFFLGIACVLFSGWVAVRLYAHATRRNVLRPFVFPLFLVLCTLTYIVHTVQNFRFIYDMPSLAFFALGFYLIYARKPVLWFILLFAVATLNRETTLLLLPFWAVSQSLDKNDHLSLKRMMRPRVLVVVLPLALYWTAWHHIVYSIFATNPSEYYSRLLFNLKCFTRLRYWPQLASAFAFLWPALIAGRRHITDPQLRAWLSLLPVWYAVMLVWAVMTETRVFGELLPLLAPMAALIAEEALLQRFQRSGASAVPVFAETRKAA